MEQTGNIYNTTVKKYLEAHMGPQHISPAVVVPITVVYVLIFVSGVVGNVVVCLVVSRNSHFQTPTNYYLFSLAISDLLILIFGLPNDLKVYWQQYPWVFGETVCKLRALVAEMTSYASVLTIVAFTTERYIAICHPLFIQTVSTLPRAIKLITSVWVVACLSAIPFAVFTKINYVEYPMGSGNFLQESAFCALPLEHPHINRPLVQFSTFAFFCLPMTVIVILYAKIGFRLRNSRFSRMSSNDSSRYSPSQGDGRQTILRRSVHRMLVAVVIAFFVCWAPFHAQRLLAVYVPQDQWTVPLRTLNEVLYYTAGCLYYFSATINPILYSLMSAKYREAFREALCTFSPQKRDGEHSIFRFSRHPSENFAHSDREMSIRDKRDCSSADDLHAKGVKISEAERPLVNKSLDVPKPRVLLTVPPIINGRHRQEVAEETENGKDNRRLSGRDKGDHPTEVRRTPPSVFRRQSEQCVLSHLMCVSPDPKVDRKSNGIPPITGPGKRAEVWLRSWSLPDTEHTGRTSNEMHSLHPSPVTGSERLCRDRIRHHSVNRDIEPNDHGHLSNAQELIDSQETCV